MFHRRRDDLAPAAAPAAADPELPRLAVSWLQELLHAEFADDPLLHSLRHPQGAGEADPGAEAGEGAEEGAALAVWRREWVRRWGRLQLPEQLAACGEALLAERTAAGVHRILAEHGRRVAGGYACLLFLPAGGDGRLRPVADPSVPAGLWLAEDAARAAGIFGAEAAVPGAALEGVAPLFHDVGAVALGVAPCAGGVAVLVERRRERELGPLDLEILRVLCAQADAALDRIRLLERVGAAEPAGAGTGRLEDVLRHASAGAALGHPVTVVAVRVHGGEGDACEGVLRRETGGAGPVLRSAPGEFTIVLHGDRAAAEALLARARQEMQGRCTLHAGIAPHDPAAGSAGELLRRARAALAAG